jgi:pimeloyl-ACP methyl ester carboxylesterase
MPSLAKALSALLLLAPACATRDTSPPEAPVEEPPAVALESAEVKQLCGSGSRRAWLILKGDDEVGKTRGQCVGKDARGWHLVSQLTSAGAETPDYELHLWLDRHGKPKAAQLRKQTVVTRYRWLTDGLRVERHGDANTLMAPEGATTEDLWIVPSHALFIRETMLRLGIGASPDGVEHVSYAPSLDGVVSLTLGFEQDPEEGLIARADRGTFGLRSNEPATLAGLRIARVTTANEAISYRELPGDASWEPAMPEIPKPEYTPPDDLQIVPVEIPGPGDEPTLAGEIVAPTDLGGQSHPGAVFLSGSGPQDRYGFVPGTSIDVGSHEIHDALARAGFVVLRYDDRGVGRSELGPTSTPGYLSFVSDARRAAAFLARRPEVDARKIIVIGHSEGALTATIVGRERFSGGRGRHRLAGVVLMASTGRGLREVIYSQIRGSMAGKPEAEIEAAIADARKIHDAVESGGEVPASTEAARNWMKEVFREDPVANLRRLKIPILVLQGGKDFQVDPKLDYGPLADLVTGGKAGTKGSEAHLVEDVDHLFKPEPGESKLGHYSDLSRHVAPEVIERIVQWSAMMVGRR